jgi:geranylgeranyl reductase family protein
MTATDVLVVGSGPAGAAVAAALARAGASVLLVEAARHPRPKACAEYASPRILEELARIGLGHGDWSDAAVPLRGMDLHVGSTRVRLGYAERSGRARMAWGLDRRQYDARLAAHAAHSGATLLEETRAVRLLSEDGRVVGARLRHSSSGRESDVRADWVVGADGARSTVARQLGVERRVVAPRRLGLVAHYTGVAGLADHGEMHVGRDWYVGLAPTPGGELNVGMALPLDTATGSSAARFADAIERLPAVAERVRGTRRLTPIRGAAPIGHRVARAAGPGWLLVGDAAGFVDPFTGEGIHRALRSARAAADAILAGGDVVAAYRQGRRRAFAAKSTLSWLVQGFLAVPWLIEHAVSRLEARPQAALLLGSALGDCRPATDALTPRAIMQVLR